jgi:hypothetical protein
VERIQRFAEAGGDAQEGAEGREAILPHQLNEATAEPVFRPVELAIDFDDAGGGWKEAGEAAGESRLAGA